MKSISQSVASDKSNPKTAHSHIELYNIDAMAGKLESLHGMSHNDVIDAKADVMYSLQAKHDEYKALEKELKPFFDAEDEIKKEIGKLLGKEIPFSVFESGRRTLSTGHVRIEVGFKKEKKVSYGADRDARIASLEAEILKIKGEAMKAGEVTETELPQVYCTNTVSRKTVVLIKDEEEKE